jgi:hypothetical protein
MMLRHRLLHSCLPSIVLMTLMFPGSMLFGQWRYSQGFDALPRLRGPSGESAITSKFTSVADPTGHTIKLGITSRDIYSTGDFGRWTVTWPPRGSKELFNDQFVAGNYNSATASALYKSYTGLTANGSVYQLGPSDNYKTATEWNPVPFTLSYEYGVKIRGNFNYHVLSSQSLYITRDYGLTWNTNIAGLGVGYPSDLSLDSHGNAWLAYSTGLYMQSRDSVRWTKVSSFPEQLALAVFNDRRDWTFVSTYSNLYYSTNQGSTWNPNHSGLPVQGVMSISDDAYNRVFSVTNTFGSFTKLYRSVGGTSSWTRIDQPMTVNSYDPDMYSIINEVTGDSVLIAATFFGFYISTDGGDTWTEEDCGETSDYVYALEEFLSGRRLISTTRGIYYRDPADTAWKKTFPPSGYMSNRYFFKDNAEIIYTQGERSDPSNYFSIPITYTSTDRGLNWVRRDTTGSAQINNWLLYNVDKGGAEHYASFGSPNLLYARKPGLSWALDNFGYAYRSPEQPTTFGSDGRGSVYIAMALHSFASTRPGNGPAVAGGAGDGILWRRPISGGSWVVDTTGLNANSIYVITSDTSGDPIVGTYGDGLYHRSGTTWSKIPSPPGLGSSSPFVASVDRSNAIFAGFADLVGVNYLWRGVYFTADMGASWTHCGLDSVWITSLVSFGDTTFAITGRDGVYRLTGTGVTAVGQQTKAPVGFALYQNYPNPFNPSTGIRYRVSGSGIVTLKVYDVLGREVATLVNERKTPGSYSVRFDASGLASGVYFYRLQAGSFAETKKLLLLR